MWRNVQEVSCISIGKVSLLTDTRSDTLNKHKQSHAKKDETLATVQDIATHPPQAANDQLNQPVQDQITAEANINAES